MTQIMCLQIDFLRKGFCTNFTLKLFLSCVNTLMDRKACFILKHVLAKTTLGFHVSGKGWIFIWKKKIKSCVGKHACWWCIGTLKNIELENFWLPRQFYWLTHLISPLHHFFCPSTIFWALTIYPPTNIFTSPSTNSFCQRQWHRHRQSTRFHWLDLEVGLISDNFDSVSTRWQLKAITDKGIDTNKDTDKGTDKGTDTDKVQIWLEMWESVDWIDIRQIWFPLNPLNFAQTLANSANKGIWKSLIELWHANWWSSDQQFLKEKHVLLSKISANSDWVIIQTVLLFLDLKSSITWKRSHVLFSEQSYLSSAKTYKQGFHMFLGKYQNSRKNLLKQEKETHILLRKVAD